MQGSSCADSRAGRSVKTGTTVCGGILALSGPLSARLPLDGKRAVQTRQGYE